MFVSSVGVDLQMDDSGLVFFVVAVAVAGGGWMVLDLCSVAVYLSEDHGFF